MKRSRILRPSKVLRLSKVFLVFFFCVSAISSRLFAADIIPPENINAGRFDTDHKKQNLLAIPKIASPLPESASQEVKIPEQAKKIHFILRNIVIEGATAFRAEELHQLYSKYLDQEISLDIVWQIAAAITKHYQDHGYFLAQAIVPEQAIDKSGIFKIKIVEGYISDVEFDNSSNDIRKNYVIDQLIAKITSQKPANIKNVESILLQLNDLPGVSFRSVIKPVKNVEGAAQLVLVPQYKKGSTQISIDNYNSMYLGPYEGTYSLETSIFPLNKTSLSILRSSPLNKLKYFNAANEMTIMPGLSLGIYGGRTDAHPGHTLKPYEIKSVSNNFGISFNQQIIRQRLMNLAVKFKLEGKNVASDILNTAITRDKIREFAIDLAYDGQDLLKGYNYLNLTFTHGITAFGASESTDRNLSRVNVNPEYRKYELSVSRFQGLGESWVALTSAAMQLASGALYSSSQFGYGGQTFGRAYDSSEISGDNGVNFATELRYTGIPSWYKFTLTPYGFYDIGKVWDIGDSPHARNSAGGGFRFEAGSNFSGNFTIASPLMHGVQTPRHANDKAPRYLFQMSFKF